MKAFILTILMASLWFETTLSASDLHFNIQANTSSQCLTAIVANENAEQDELNQSLFEAAGHGDEVKVRALITKGANLNAIDCNGKTPLDWAAGRYNLFAAINSEVIKMLIVKGANLNATDYDGNTPLHSCAGLFGNEIAIKLLLAHGVDINARNLKGHTPLHVATWFGKPLRKIGAKISHSLMDQGADLNAPDNEGCTPLQVAVKNGYTEGIQILTAEGAALNPQVNKRRIRLKLLIDVEAEVQDLVKSLRAGGTEYSFRFTNAQM